VSEKTDRGTTLVGSSICALCVAVADATRHATPFLHNQKLLETDRFIVLPSLGPLMPGHVMVVGKDIWTVLLRWVEMRLRNMSNWRSISEEPPFFGMVTHWRQSMDQRPTTRLALVLSIRTYIGYLDWEDVSTDSRSVYNCYPNVK